MPPAPNKTPKEATQSAEVVLVGFEGAGNRKIPAERRENRRQGQLAGHMEIAQGQFLFDPLLFGEGDSFVSCLKRFLDQVAVQVVADPISFFASVQARHGNLLGAFRSHLPV